MSDFKEFVDSNLKDASCQILNELRKSETLTDLTLMSEDGYPTRVHKNILWSTSAYFRGIFESDAIESRQDTIQMRDNIVDSDLKLIVEYLYTGIAKVSKKSVPNCYVNAQYFNLRELQYFCGKMLLENINHDNCLEYWRHGVKYLNDELRDACIKHLVKNANILIDQYISCMTLEELEKISSHKNAISQETICSGIIRWVHCDLETREQHLEKLIKNVDFTKMSQKYLKIEVSECELLFKKKEIGSDLFRAMLTRNSELENKMLSRISELETNLSTQIAYKNRNSYARHF